MFGGMTTGATAGSVIPGIGTLAGAGIGLAGDFISSLFGQGQAKRNQKQQHKYNKDMADHMYAKDLEMWNTQNAYNTPASQMQRFKDAGLNSHLIYGRGESGNAGQMPKYQRQTVDKQTTPPLALGDVMTKYNSLRSTNVQVDNVKAMTDNAKEQRKNLILDGLIKTSQGKSEAQRAKQESINTMYFEDFKRANLDQVRKDIDLKAAQINLASKQAQGVIAKTQLDKADLDWMKKTGLHRNDPILAKNAKYLAQTMGVSEFTVISAVGGVLGLQALLNGIGQIKGFGLGKGKTKSFKGKAKQTSPNTFEWN